MYKGKLQRKMIAADWVRRLLLGWLLAVTVEYLLLPGDLRKLEGLLGLCWMSQPRVIFVTVCAAALLWLLSRRLNTEGLERWGLAAAFGVLSAAALASSFSWPFFTVCLVVLVVLAVYALRGWNCEPETAALTGKNGGVWLWLTVGLSAVVFLILSVWTVGRVRSFSTPTYDFGIFSQMFYHMGRSGQTVTTLERDGLLPHFAVHVSPIYYLMLPFYCLVPRPETLQVMQAAVVVSAVIPLWLLGKRHGLTACQRFLICTVLLLYPAYTGGVGYDLHENCFLTPLLLWLFYGIDRKKSMLTAIAAILTLMVKEDAAIYVAVVAVWLVLKTLLRPGKKDVRDLSTGLLLFVASVGWFLLVTRYLAERGDGVMTYRYKNFMYDGGSSLVTVVKSVLLCPMKAVYECVDREKLRFIALTLLPLLLLLPTRRYERYILLIPYLLVNLMPDYRYQHDIFFQYGFGSTACLIYLAAVNLSDFKKGRTMTAAVAAVLCAVCFATAVLPAAVRYPVRAVRYCKTYDGVRDTLDTIPEEAPVAATTFYTTYLSRRETIYDVRYCSREHLLETEYVVLSLNAESDYAKFSEAGENDGLKNLVGLLEENGYRLYRMLDGTLAIYRRT